MNYTDYKRDLAVRILRKIDAVIRDDNSVPNDLIVAMTEALDDFLPTDDSPNRGHTEFVDLACVYEVDECPNCGKKHVQYSDAYEFCNECGYTFN